MAHTKMTGPPKAKETAKAKPNGATKTPATQSPAIKSPNQQIPMELSEKDRENVKKWLDDANTEFKVATAPMSRKRKRSGALQPQTGIFEERLDVQYEIMPRNNWECLRRYKKFTVGSESITTGQCILVKHDDGEDQGIDPSKQWKAKVLEVRALDTEHVYIRVAWLNRPEDLSGGRKSYHGKYELIPTNQMDIIDAMTVNGSCNVVHWDEQDDESPALPEDQFFWRQTYNHVGTKTFSNLRKICVDNAPVNPDEMILQCANESCMKWQHLKCIAEAAVKDAADARAKPASKKSAKRKKPNDNDDNITIRSDSLAQAKAKKDGFTSEVMISGQANNEGQSSPDHSYIVVTDLNGEKTVLDVQCLFCKTNID